jgi:DNA-binding transcriptional ArsR family regulator
VLEKAVTAAYDALIVDQWPRLEASYQEDLIHRQRLMFTEGVEAAVASVFPDARWNGLVLELDGRRDRDIHLSGRGITLAPSGFWAGRPAISHGVSGRPLLIVYAARILLPFVDRMPSFSSGGRTLAPLIGKTRAAVLDTIVSSPAITTSALAQHLGISAGRASEHASVLRQAGLIMSHRHRNTVLHTPTTLGTDLNPS